MSSSIKEMIDGNRILPGRHAEALTKLDKIFNLNLDIKQLQQEKERPTYQTSSTPTMKAAVQAAPRAHSRVTGNDKPGILPTTEGEKRQPKSNTDKSPIATSGG